MEELIGEMEKIIKYDTTERVRVPRGSIVDTIDLELSEHDLENDLGRIVDSVKEHTDPEGWALFSKVVHEYDVRKTVYTLLCLLYLVQQEKIDLKQDKIYGEIFIHLNAEKRE